MTSLSIRSALPGSCRDHVAAASELRLRRAPGDPNGFAEAAAPSRVDRRHDAQILGEHAVAGVGAGQQRNDLDHAFLSDRRRLPAVRPPDNDVGEVRRIEQSVWSLDEYRPDLLDEAIEVEDVLEAETALERGAELGVRDLLR